MKLEPATLKEDLRLQDLYSYDILDSEAEKEFDNLLELAADLCKCPIAAITFIDKDRQWLKSKIGLDASQTPRDIAFCTHTILQDEVLQVKDATLDERFSNNPLVTGELFIRFYAGAPIVSTNGYNLGSVCVIDQHPRELNPEQHKVLTILSQQISKLLELRIKNKVLKSQSQKQLQLEKFLLQKTLEEQEAERSSISVELHENIAQGIAATKFYLDIAQDGGSNEKELIRKSKDMLGDVLQQVQDLSNSICPTTLKEIYLKDSLENLIKDFSKKNKINCEMAYESSKEIKPDLAINIYRIVEEQLNNIEEHSRATMVSINLQIFESIYLAVKDNGKGFSLNTFQKGVGLNRILSRVEKFGGSVDINSGVNSGCELRIMIPISEAIIPADKP